MGKVAFSTIIEHIAVCFFAITVRTITVQLRNMKGVYLMEKSFLASIFPIHNMAHHRDVSHADVFSSLSLTSRHPADFF